MVMMAPPIVQGVEEILGDDLSAARILITSASGRRFTQSMAHELADEARVVIICGHYEGIDARVAEILGAEEISVGDYVLTGGELAVAVARGAPVKLLLSDNGSYASIRIHQERAHPGRVSGTDLVNPDFRRWCEAFRVPVLAVDSRADLPKLDAALRAPGPLAAVVRTSLSAVLPPDDSAPE